MRDDVERLARLICEERGEDPDAPYGRGGAAAWHLMRRIDAVKLLEGYPPLHDAERRALARLREGGD